MIMKIIKNASIRTKILGLILGLTIILSIIIYLLIFFFSGRIANDIKDEVLSESKTNLESIINNVYKSCEVTDQVLTKYLTNKLNQYKDIISRKGRINVSNELIEWNAVDQFTKASKNISIPKVMIGGSWIGKINSFEIKQSIVDDLNEENFTFTIFQKMNERGDMLRVATNVKTNEGVRAIGTYIPAINADGSDNKVIKTVLSGSTYFGNAFVVNDYYQTVYEPYKDANGNIIGMIYVGVSLNAANKLRESILSIKVGESGYAYVLGGSGTRKGYYIISKDGARDGESIWDAKDSDGRLVIQEIINKATGLPTGKFDYIDYKWFNKGDKEPVLKIVALAYFKPFDWVIGVGVNKSDLEKTSNLVVSSFSELYLYLGISIIILLVLVYFLAAFVSSFITNPIKHSTEIMYLISKGNIKDAIKRLDSNINE